MRYLPNGIGAVFGVLRRLQSETEAVLDAEGGGIDGELGVLREHSGRREKMLEGTATGVQRG